MTLTVPNNSQSRQNQIIEKRISDNIKVDKLVKKSNRVLLKISSHAFPIDLFPDVLVIEEGRINIVIRHLFTSQVHSVDIRNIANVLIDTSIFFAQITIVSKTYEENEIKIQSLLKGQAIYARRIIEGLRTFENRKISTSSYSKEELLQKLQQLSTTEIVL